MAGDARGQEARRARQGRSTGDARAGIFDGRLRRRRMHLDQHLGLQVVVQGKDPLPLVQRTQRLVASYLLLHLDILLLLAQEAVVNLDVLLRLGRDLGRDIGSTAVDA
eukprot:CAMPEP_0179123318 /NCGR_PEP_ID=MMETSP0796-20121207/58236_1 /TAXON_ID=73915 /ORGANISM="Pyrodinium bahamense, Strain pbaha01" /LENGTH=107 /DNA_ID=CAMNT_0020821961 /DNA_START=278 /DNA_END=601 /DNA_ORIENTATION=-